MEDTAGVNDNSIAEMEEEDKEAESVDDDLSLATKNFKITSVRGNKAFRICLLNGYKRFCTGAGGIGDVPSIPLEQATTSSSPDLLNRKHSSFKHPNRVRSPAVVSAERSIRRLNECG